VLLTEGKGGRRKIEIKGGEARKEVVFSREAKKGKRVSEIPAPGGEGQV